MSTPDLMPVAFVAHGAPLLALDAAKGGELAAWSAQMPRPRAILCISAHWETPQPMLGSTAPRELIYDFYGFPPPLYALRYPAPAAPDLADRVSELLRKADFEVGRDPTRGLDHGVWVPLLHMYPRADVPVLQLSLARGLDGAGLLALGRALAPLRGEGVLITASGVLVHNLGEIDFRDRAPAPVWAEAFDHWVGEALRAWDLDALADFRRRAPQARQAHPSDEHYTPLLVAAGAADAPRPRVTFPVQGFEYGSLSRRCVQLD